MARFNVNDVDNYATGGSGSFFQLKDDGDMANVRFLYDQFEDVDGLSVHQVELPDGKHRYVNCLRSYNDPIDMCPLCAAKYKLMTKLFLKLYNIDANEVQVWERGKSFYNDLKMVARKCDPLYTGVIEITRNGKKGDKSTKYSMFIDEKSDFDIDSVETSDVLGTIVLDKTAEEMDYFLNTGVFPGDDEAQKGNSRQSNDDFNRPVGRRTPQNNRPQF